MAAATRPSGKGVKPQPFPRVSLQVTMVLSEHTRYSGAMQYLLNVTSAIASGLEGEPTFRVNGLDGMS